MHTILKRATLASPQPGGRIARKTVFVSDLTGNEIDERNGAKVTIAYNDARRGTVVLDVNADEVDDLARKGTKQARRGRKPKGSRTRARSAPTPLQDATTRGRGVILRPSVVEGREGETDAGFGTGSTRHHQERP